VRPREAPIDPAGRERRIDLTLWLVAAAAVWLTVWLSLLSEPPSPTGIPGIDKVEHALAYLVTTFAVLLVAVWRPGRGPGRFPGARWWIAGAALGAGALIEVLQSALTTDRQGDVRDWLAEVVGVGLALLALRALERRSPAPT
jgi:VanZ family protein